MFAAPVAKPRTPSHGAAPSATVWTPLPSGKERSFRTADRAIDAFEQQPTDASNAECNSGRLDLAGWAHSDIPVFPQGREAHQRRASAGAATAPRTAAPSPTPGPRLQAKLAIGRVDDPLEHEADQIADQVMGAPGSLAVQSAPHQAQRKCSACAHEEKEHGKLHRKCAKCENEDEEKKVARKAVSPAGPAAGMEAPSTVSQVLRSPGQPLDPASRSFFEPRFGYNFGRVRVHTDENAAAAARSVGALAYTVGRHIVFGSNQYAAGTAAGQRLLAHELAHTVQQGAADGLETARAEADPGADGMLLQRQEVPGVHDSAPQAAPYEKSSPDVESRYRRSGLIDAANAVKRCREGGCAKVLTEAEAYAAYRSGRVSAGLGDAPAKEDGGGKGKVAGAGAAPLLAGALARSTAPATTGGGAVVESAAARGAARGLRSVAEVVVKDAAAAAPEAATAAAPAAAAPAAAPAAAGAATVAVPIALGVYLIVGVVDLVAYTRFQVALERQGYVILPNMLQVCISGCHHADAPTDTFGPPGSGLPTFPFDEAGDKAIRDWIRQGAPQTPAAPLPPVAGKPVVPLAPPAPSTDKPVMPDGLSRKKKDKWKKCAELYKTYKKETGSEVGSLAGEIKAAKGNVDSFSPKQKLELCSKIHQLIALIEQLIRERRDYIDNGCDEFDWFKKGTTEDQRRQKHEGEVNNVKGQEGNMRGVLKELEEKGIC